MKRKLVFFIGISLSLGCASKHLLTDSHSDFVRFTNNNKITLTADGTSIPDKNFSLQIPNTILKCENIAGGDFTHILFFAHSEKIIVLYIINKSHPEGTKLFDLNYKGFDELCEKEDIGYCFSSNKIKLLKNRRFGINEIKTQYGCVYAMYINIRPDYVKAYNYSISSLTVE